MREVWGRVGGVCMGEVWDVTLSRAAGQAHAAPEQRARGISCLFPRRCTAAAAPPGQLVSLCIAGNETEVSGQFDRLDNSLCSD